MKDFIDDIDYYGLSARIKRLSDSLNSEARKMYSFLNFEIEPNWHLVFLSLKEESLSVTEIAKQLQFSHPAIVKIVKKMKERGYVKSIQDEKDSRRQLLSLTKKSEKLLPKFEEQWNHIQRIIQECSDEGFLQSIRFFENKLKEKSLSQRLKHIHMQNRHTELQYSILNCTQEDIPTITKLYEQAIALMKSKKQVHWPEFPQAMIENEIRENSLWKIVVEKEIACIWTTAFSDPTIWEEKNQDPSVYIHKIATAPEFRGNKLVGKIVQWTKGFAREHQKEYIRMDTVGDNKSLIKHYEKHGFNFLGSKKLKTTEGLPKHYEKGDVCLFEIRL